MLSAAVPAFLKGAHRPAVLLRAFASNHHVIRTTEQGQGNIMDRLSDPEEMQRLLRAQKQGSLLDETLADIIVRETLEARADELVKRVKEATTTPEQCGHDDEHALCCGASRGNVEGSE